MDAVATNGSEGMLVPGAPHTGYQSSTKPPLTKRELEVLQLMAEGLTTKVIAARLGVTFKTAACHRGRILQKLSVDSTVSAVRWAIRVGIIQP
jgi:DNA-binding NarL/FixJ family response regulator